MTRYATPNGCKRFAETFSIAHSGNYHALRHYDKVIFAYTFDVEIVDNLPIVSLNKPDKVSYDYQPFLDGFLLRIFTVISVDGYAECHADAINAFCKMFNLPFRAFWNPNNGGSVFVRNRFD